MLTARAAFCIAAASLVFTPAADAQATQPSSPDAQSIIASLAVGQPARNRTLLSAGTEVSKNQQLLDDPAVFEAFASCAKDPDPSVRAEAARTIGQVWVWGHQPQKAEAIALEEVLARDPVHDVAHFAIYFGLSTAKEKTDDVLRAMFDAATALDEWEPNTDGRILWGCRGLSAERLLPICEGYWSKLDEKPAAAWIVHELFVQITGKEPPNPERFVKVKAALDERAAAETRENLAQMPDLADRIRNDTTAERAELYGEILSKPHLFRDLDEQVLDAMLVAAADKDAKGRAAAMRLIGQRWIWNEPKGKQNPKAIDLAERLATDPDSTTRNWAIYFGLSTIIEPDDTALRAMVDGLVMPNPSDSAGRVAWASERFGKDRLKPFFEPYFAKGADAATGSRAVLAYTTIFGQPPTNVAATQPADRDYAGTFRAAYDHLGEVYPAFEMKKIDWKKVGDELLPRAATIKTDREFGLLCLELVARLQDSHAQLLPGTAEVPTVDFPHFDAGFACITDTRDRPVIYYVDPDGPAERAGVRVGMTVVSVNGVPATDAINAWLTAVLRYSGASSDRTARYDAVRYFAQMMKENDPVKLDVETLDGTRKTFDLTATLDSRYVPRLPVPIEGINDSADVSFKRLDGAAPGEIGYLHVRRIRDNLPASLDEAIKAFNEPPKIKGLILDVRGNSGGGFDEEAALRNFHENDPLEPDRPRYAGPIAMLIDERCISAGEGWSSWFVANKKARLFGTTTAGASSRKEEYALTNGLYKILLPVKTYTGFLDRPIEVRGLEPDEPVRCRAADLAAGKDTVLEAARTWLKR